MNLMTVGHALREIMDKPESCAAWIQDLEADHPQIAKALREIDLTGPLLSELYEQMKAQYGHESALSQVRLCVDALQEWDQHCIDSK